MDEELPQVTPGKPKREIPPQLKAHQFKPGDPKRGGRRRFRPNQDRALTVDRIIRTADPIGALCRVANGDPLLAAAEPAATEVTLVYPTVADRLTALRILAAKIMPDLKAVEVADGGQLVNVVLQLGQKVVVAPAEAPDR